MIKEQQKLTVLKKALLEILDFTQYAFSSESPFIDFDIIHYGLTIDEWCDTQKWIPGMTPGLQGTSTVCRWYRSCINNFGRDLRRCDYDWDESLLEWLLD